MPEHPAPPLPGQPQAPRPGASAVAPLPDGALDVLAERARHAVAAREEERRRLAAELHDVASTNLAAIKLNLASIARALPSDAVQAVQSMADAQSLLGETIAGIRALCSALRPSVLDHVPLAEALQAHCASLVRRTGLEIDLDLAAYDTPCAPELELTLLRVAQEALWNCVKHAQAGRVRIWFERIEGRRRFSILDDGLGFDVARLADADATRGIGILNMQERALSTGARFALESTRGRGTLVRLDF
jgi:signal transduction histidine kinase